MSDVLPESDLETADVGRTSADMVDGDDSQGLLKSMTVYDTMLVLAFLFIAFATLRLFLVLRTYSDGFPFGGFPWKTSEYQWLMWF